MEEKLCPTTWEVWVHTHTLHKKPKFRAFHFSNGLNFAFPVGHHLNNYRLGLPSFLRVNISIKESDIYGYDHLILLHKTQITSQLPFSFFLIYDSQFVPQKPAVCVYIYIYRRVILWCILCWLLLSLWQSTPIIHYKN